MAGQDALERLISVLLFFYRQFSVSNKRMFVIDEICKVYF